MHLNLTCFVNKQEMSIQIKDSYSSKKNIFYWQVIHTQSVLNLQSNPPPSLMEEGIAI